MADEHQTERKKRKASVPLSKKNCGQSLVTGPIYSTVSLASSYVCRFNAQCNRSWRRPAEAQVRLSNPLRAKTWRKSRPPLGRHHEATLGVRDGIAIDEGIKSVNSGRITAQE